MRKICVYLPALVFFLFLLTFAPQANALPPGWGCADTGSRCSGDTLQACNSDNPANNYWYDVRTCEYGCQNGGCVNPTPTTAPTATNTPVPGNTCGASDETGCACEESIMCPSGIGTYKRCVSCGGGGTNPTLTPTPIVVVDPVNPTATPTAIPPTATPTRLPTPPGVTLTPPAPVCSPDGWSAEFTWTKPDFPANPIKNFILRVDMINKWMETRPTDMTIIDNVMAWTQWFLADGSDTHTVIINTLKPPNDASKEVTVIPFRPYYGWSVETVGTDDQTGPRVQGNSFSCRPNYTMVVENRTTTCYDDNGNIRSECSIEKFRNEYRQQHGYSVSSSDGERRYFNFVTGKNAYKFDTVMASVGTKQSELIDLLDFEAWRKLKYVTRPTATPTPTPISRGQIIDVEVSYANTCTLKLGEGLNCWDHGKSFSVAGNFYKISAREDNICAIDTDGKISCWDLQSGKKAFTTSDSFYQFSAGSDMICGVLRSTETLKCFRSDGSQISNTAIPAETVSVISVGHDHACATRRSDGAILCWGGNQFGQVDIPSDIGDVNGISAGENFTCAIKANGKVQCWGYEITNTPPVDNFEIVSSGRSNACGIRSDNKQVICWGEGAPGMQNLTSPPSGQFLDVSVLATHACALKTDRTLVCWGDYPPIPTTTPTATPTPVPGSPTPTTVGIDIYPPPIPTSTVTCKYERTNQNTGAKYYTATYSWDAVTDVGSAGLDVYPYWSQASYDTSFSPILNNWNNSWTSARTRTTLLLGESTPVYFHVRSQDAKGNKSEWSTTQSIIPNDTNCDVTTPAPIARISVSESFSCAMRNEDSVQCWGDNTSGQLGNNSKTPTNTPVVINTKNRILKNILLGRSHSCGITSSGGVQCWGYNEFGQLGVAQPNYSSPLDVSGLGTDAIQSVAHGFNHSCALTINGAVKCWGANSFGQLGNGNHTDSIPTPAAVIGLTSGIKSIALASTHSCGVTSSGNVKCWGDNSVGQLGNSTITAKYSDTPVDVTGLTNVKSISTIGRSICALKNSGSVFCWGDNSFGQLGDGTKISKNSPVGVTGLTNAVGIAMGYQHTCAILTDKTVQCWGKNDVGQLGDNSTVDKATPAIVRDLSDVKSIALGYQHTCALTTEGGVKCWGINSKGQLGNGAIRNNFVPDDVEGLTVGVDFIFSGFDHSCAQTTENIIKCWGNNSSGQLGNGSIIYSNVPVPVQFN